MNLVHSCRGNGHDVFSEHITIVILREQSSIYPVSHESIISVNFSCLKQFKHNFLHSQKCHGCNQEASLSNCNANQELHCHQRLPCSFPCFSSSQWTFGTVMAIRNNLTYQVLLIKIEWLHIFKSLLMLRTRELRFNLRFVILCWVLEP